MKRKVFSCLEVASHSLLPFLLFRERGKRREIEEPPLEELSGSEKSRPQPREGKCCETEIFTG